MHMLLFHFINCFLSFYYLQGMPGKVKILNPSWVCSAQFYSHQYSKYTQSVTQHFSKLKMFHSRATYFFINRYTEVKTKVLPDLDSTRRKRYCGLSLL